MGDIPMKKIKFTAFIMLLLFTLSGCGGSEIAQGEKSESSAVAEEGREMIDGASELISKGYSIGGFENASINYDKYNSYASENGLGDTLIYIEGSVLNQTKFDNSDSETPTLALVIEQEDSNRWCVSVTSDSKIKEIEGKKVRIFGTYMGFSDVMNLPGMAIFVDDTEYMGDARIEIEEMENM